MIINWKKIHHNPYVMVPISFALLPVMLMILAKGCEPGRFSEDSIFKMSQSCSLEKHDFNGIHCVCGLRKDDWEWYINRTDLSD